MNARVSRLGIAASGLVFAGCLLLYGIGFLGSPFANERSAVRQDVIVNHARAAHVDLVREGVLARAYWERNPDVADDPFFGETGVLGVFGARTHYDRHGRKEGRTWGP